MEFQRHHCQSLVKMFLACRLIYASGINHSKMPVEELSFEYCKRDQPSDMEKHWNITVMVVHRLVGKK
eukprot:9401323-Ditylum_brightwellii.AAC.1